MFKGDELVGTYGVSGGTSDQDETMARHVRARVGWAHLRENDNTPDDAKRQVNELYARIGLDDREL